MNLGAIKAQGDVQTEYANWEADAIGCIELAHAYQAALAEFLGGEVRKTPHPSSWYVTMGGTTRPRLVDMLAKEEAWRAAIVTFVTGLQEAMMED